jgi:hypothetical protein
MDSFDNDVCRSCGNTRVWHEQHHPRHPFVMNGPALLHAPDDAVPQTSHVDLPFDPILRLALVNNGIITADQLSQAEKDFRMINGGENAHNGRSE